jgi:hypothetical protein
MILSQSADAGQPGAAPAGAYERALADLREHAVFMSDEEWRAKPPLEILFDLMYRAALHRCQGADIPEGTELAIVRALPGVGAGWCPVSAWRERVRDSDHDALAEGLDAAPDDGVHAEEARRHSRAMAAAGWLMMHAGEHVAELAVRAVEIALALHVRRSQCQETPERAGNSTLKTAS